jgi:hypothetical protein
MMGRSSLIRGDSALSGQSCFGKLPKAFQCSLDCRDIRRLFDT